MSDFKTLAKHSTNYLAATMATKALAFISIPVYTRLLTVAEYGIMQVFISTVAIVQVLLTLNSEVAVSRYYYDAKSEQDFKEFVSTTVKITSRIWLLMTIIMVLLVSFLSKQLSFSKLLTLALIPVATYNSINSIFGQIYQPLLQSRKIAVVSSIQAYLAFALSVIYILILDHDKYYGYALGTITAMVLLSVYLVNQIKPYYVRCKINKEHVKYILNYCIPYIPYTLSGVLLAQFGKIVMSNYGGFSSAGLYSFVANIAALMMILISVAHSAWNPYYLQYMTDKDYKSIDKDYDLIWRVTLLASIGLSLFGKEIGALLGKPIYLSSMYILPILILGYLFYQWAYVYLRSTGFAKKTIWNAVAVVTSGTCNICLNVVLVKKWAELGIAVSFAVSYFMLLVISYIINLWILKQYTPRVWKFIWPLIITVPFLCISGWLITKGENIDIKYILIKFCLFSIFSVLIMFNYIYIVKNNIKAKKNNGRTDN